MNKNIVVVSISMKCTLATKVVNCCLNSSLNIPP